MAVAYEYKVAQYRNWYAKQLRFYPKPYRERFGERMEQTFNDLCRERRAAENGVSGFVLRVCVETSAGIIGGGDYPLGENITFMIMKNINIIIRPALLTVGILLIPFLGNMYIDGWNWPWTAFAFLGAILFGAGLAYELAGKYAKAGVIGGFIVGGIVAAGVIATVRYMHPEEDVAGIVIITFLFSGLFFALIGYVIQTYLKRR